jgi:hypothetical protein
MKIEIEDREAEGLLIVWLWWVLVVWLWHGGLGSWSGFC